MRSFDRDMPEEINRILTDQIADLLYTTERSAADNLRAKASRRSAIVFVGNVMIDSLHRASRARGRAGADARARRRRRGVRCRAPRASASSRCTGRRTSTTPRRSREVLDDAARGRAQLPLVWPVHPRAQANIDRFGLARPASPARGLLCLPPQGYLEMLGLLAGARLVLTDSGGVQEETTALGVPCLTMRDNTERPITVEQGTNTLVGRDRGARARVLSTTILATAASAAACPSSGTARPPSASPPISRHGSPRACPPSRRRAR